MMVSLPVDELLPDIARAVAGANVVVEAPPGAGKTTRVPPALLRTGRGDVLVLEPRRIAARLAARRVAAEMGERTGETVGYQVRFEDVSGPKTRLKFLTEGVLTRRLIADPALRGVGTVVLDEFHERHLEGDLALAMLLELQRTRRADLRLVVMSATLDTAPVARHLGDCPVLRSEGKLFDLDMRYTPHSATPLEEQIAAALESLLAAGHPGDVLVFLPGAAEIRRAARACRALAARAGILLLPLHGDLAPEEQDRAVAPARERKVILSTNVAESSITIEGVTAVIDSGLARVAIDSPWTGIPSLTVSRVSKASATQRAGRAARTAPGRAIRLYSEEDFARRPEHDRPEIERRELSPVLLALHAWGAADPRAVPWLTPPPDESIEAAEKLLRELGALDAGGGITGDGRRVAALPLHPRLARLIVSGEARGAGLDACRAAAALSAGERMPDEPPHPSPSDLLVLIEEEWSSRARQVFNQIRGAVNPRRRGSGGDDALRLAVLAAFPDRVARRRQGNELLLAAGGSAVLAPQSAVRDHDWLVAIDIEERRERGLPLVRLASAIEPEWLIDLFPERIREHETVEWNRKAERVERVNALLYQELAIEETRRGDPDPVLAAELLASKALEAGIDRFVDREKLDAFLARAAFAAGYAALPRLGEEDVKLALQAAAAGLRSFDELRSASVLGILEARLSAAERRLLEQVAPERIRLPRGRSVQVHYETGKPPWIASRLQDFFGMKESPRVARGAVPVVLHLLAPNQRPVQTTTDLAGFWERLYPQVRRELCRRYPKHSWPESPHS